MADTPPGAGYVSGPYDHTNDNPPHQHGGTDAPECTTCLPSELTATSPWNGLTEVPESPPWEPRSIFKSTKLDRENVIDYPDGVNRLVQEELKRIEREDADNFVPKLTERPDAEVHYYGTRGHDMGGRLLRSLRERSQGLLDAHPELWYGEWREDMSNAYPGADTPQHWSRRGLSEHIRLELEVLGLLPGRDGFVRPPSGRGDEGTEELPGESELLSPGDDRWVVDMSQVFAVQVDGKHYHPNDVQFLMSAGGSRRNSGLLDDGSGRGGDVGSSESDRSADAGASPGTWTHECPAWATLNAGRPIFLFLGQNCKGCGAKSPEQPVRANTDLWGHWCETYNQPMYSQHGTACRGCKKTEQDFTNPDRGPGRITRDSVEGILGFRLADERWADLRDYYFYQAGKGE